MSTRTYHQVSTAEAASRNELEDPDCLMAADSFICENSSKESFEARLAASPQDPYVHLWLALAHWRLGNYSAAEAEFLRAQELGVHSWRVSWYRALLVRDDKKLWNWKRYDLARELIADVSKIYPAFRPAHVFRTYLDGFYSQLGQDVLVEDFFLFNSPHVKRFVDVGAYDGVHLSNSRRLFERGWLGICIEPLLDKFSALRNLYQTTEVVCLQNAVALHEGSARITVEGTGSALVPSSQAAAGKLTQEVQIKRLSTILSENDSTKIDFLSIDAEGFDYEVLASLDFTRTRPQLIIVETNSLPEVADPIRELMATTGYVQWHDNAQDLFFRAAETNPAPNFWDIKVLSPERPTSVATSQVPSQAQSSAACVDPLPVLKSLRVLLNQHSYDKAYRLTLEIINDYGDAPLFKEIKEQLEKTLHLH